MSYRVFLSHSSADIQVANYIVDSARQIEVEVYLCEHDVQPGRHISEKVKVEIDRSDGMIVLLSPASQQSTYVQQEIGYAEGKEKLIIPIALPGFDPSKLSMLDGREYILLDYRRPESSIRGMQQFLLRKKHEKNIATGILWGIGLFLAGAFVANSENS